MCLIRRRLNIVATVLTAVLCSLGSTCPAAETELDRALQVIRNVQPDGTNSAATSAAWQVAAAATFEQLPKLFAAMDRASPLAANWISMAVDHVVATQTESGRELPVAVLEQTALDARRALVARRLALELLGRADEQRVKQLQEQLLTDPEAVLRRPAVQAAIERARELGKQNASQATQLAAWRQALTGARDRDQVLAIATGLRELGEQLDLAAHFGYLLHWRVIGPFDNTDKAGFDAVYPPESVTLENYDGPAGVFSDQSWPGKSGSVTWKSWSAGATSGNVDLNEVLGKLKEVVGYGATVYISDREQEVELRLRIQNAFKIWVNGKLVTAQPVCHTGNAFDQYQLKTRLRKGKNLILVKSCQVKPPYANPFFDIWHFSVRVCDSTGLGIPAAEPSPMQMN